jgi:putative endopeptidase
MKTKKNKNKKNKNKTIKKNMLDLIHHEQHHEKYQSFEKNMSMTLKHKKSVKQIGDELTKLFLKSSKIKPEDDFYTYINSQWLNNVKKNNLLKNKFYTQYDNFRIVQEKVYYDLIKIIEDYIKRENTSQSKNVKKLFDSLNNNNDHIAEKQIAKTIEIIDKYIANDDLYGLLAYLNRNDLVNIACPISWTVEHDLYNPTIYRSHLRMPKLPLYDLDLYMYDKTDENYRKQYKTFFKNKYIYYCKELFDAIDPNKGRDYTWLYDCGKEMYISMGSTSVPENNPLYYNIVKKDECLEKYGFDWEKFAKALGYTHVPDFFIVDNLSYLKTIMEILVKEWKTLKWRDWFIYINVKQQIRFHIKYYDIYFKFYRKFVQGAEFKVPDKISPIFVMALCFNKLLSVEYIKKYGIKEHIDYVRNFVEDLKLVFIRILENNTWLSPKTKKYAIYKLKKINFVIGSQENILDDPIIEYTDNDILENIERIYKWRLNKYISLEGKESIEMPIMDWTELKLIGRQIYIVNAFYTPQKNDIYIPLAYLQEPFIDLNERGIEYNLAHLGFTICHELSHALDDGGSNYDVNGKYSKWWNKSDIEKYNKIIENINKQYKAFTSRDKLDFNPSLSVSENLADISALTICEQYLMDFQTKNKMVTPIRILSFISFFTYFAIQMRQNIAKKAYRVQIVTNPHPPDKYRVNIPLSRLKLFRSIYNVKKDNKMFWHDIEPIW